MKRLGYLFVAIMIFSISLLPCKAIHADSSDKEEVIYFEDGSRLVIRTCVTNRGEFKDGNRTWYTASGEKYAEYYWPTGNDLAWQVVVNASFMYDGSTVMYLSSGANRTVYSQYWSCLSLSDSHTNSSATAYFTFKSVLAGITFTDSCTLSCSTNGTLY